MLLYTGTHHLEMGMFACERITGIADDTGADMLYADHYRLVNDADGIQVRKKHPLIDCQKGALRNDFDFGTVVVFRTESFRQAVAEMAEEYEYAALYDLRLRMKNIVHINEYLYTDVETDNRKSGEKQFDYVDPRNRAVQIEMEKVCTDYLKRIGAYLEPTFKEPEPCGADGDFPVTATVVIPVFNRIRTVGDAVAETRSIEAWQTLVMLMIMITVNLGVFNLLPLPALDGGRIIFLVWEGITRKPVPAKYEALIHFAGIILLMLLMLLVTYSDITKLFA